MTDPINDKTVLNEEINNIYPPEIYPDYMKNLFNPPGANLDEAFQIGGNNIFDKLTLLHKKSLLKRSDMRKIINYYKNITKNYKKK